MHNFSIDPIEVDQNGGQLPPHFTLVEKNSQIRFRLMIQIPFSAENSQSLMAFALANPWQTPWPKSLLTRFLSDLISSQDLVFDFFENEERVATAVLVDKIQNPSNDASLEILACHPQIKGNHLLKLLLPLVKEKLPLERSGFTFGFSADHTSLLSLLNDQGLKPHYEMFDMLNSSLQRNVITDLSFELAQDQDAEELYAVLKVAFAQNVDTSIPNYEDWLAGRARQKDRVTWVKREQEKIVAFLNLSLEEEVAEISTVGVLPEYRGKGFAKALIQMALSYLGERKCKLSVAVKNRKALELYLSLGFAVTGHDLVYRWTRA